MKQIAIIAGVVVVLGVGGFMYYTRPAPAPSVDVQQQGAASATELVSQQQIGQEIYRIISTESKAQFEIDETLNDKPVRVVGVTDQVSGEILFDANNLMDVQVGEIRINARTFKTDNERRNGALSRLILKSDTPEFEYITFKPTAMTGMPATLAVGERASLQITGDLTVRGVAKAVTFDTNVTRVGEDTLSGSAQAKLSYADFGLTIPKLSFLAWVDEFVTLKLEFVAKK